MKRILFIIACFFGLTNWTTIQAQCSSPNTAFQNGETLYYDLYFNWKFVWVKAGSATMNVTKTTYNSKPAYKTRLITRTSKRVDRFFAMRDTLISYTSMDLVPRYYYKGAFEGKTYRQEKVWYDYPNGKCNVRMRYQRDQNPPKFANHSSPYCAFDMISMLLRARSFDPAKYKVGHRIQFLMADGRKCEWQYIVYRGKSTFQVENSTEKYRCLVFSFVEKENGKEKEIVKFYITDDRNHLPVRLDMNLNFGVAKAYLRGAQGLRNPQTALLK